MVFMGHFCLGCCSYKLYQECISSLEPQLRFHHLQAQLFHRRARLEDGPLVCHLWCNNHLLRACVRDLGKSQRIHVFSAKKNLSNFLDKWSNLTSCSHDSAKFLFYSLVEVNQAILAW